MAYKYFAKPALLFVFTMISFSTIDAQENDSLLQKKIKSRDYFFVPESVSTSTVTAPVTSTEYGVSVSMDSIIAFLPFNGKSYSFSRPTQSSDESIKFVSTNFEYSAVGKKKGKWEITIEPKDAKGVRLFLIVFSNGNAEMDVISPGKETMLFKGYVF